jgi:type I restriction enzyme M protein
VDYSLELSKEGNPLFLWTMKKLAQNKFVCILLLIFFYPLGLYLVFQNEDWKRGKIFKWIATAPFMAGVLFIALTLILGFSGVLDDIPEKPVIEQEDQEEFSMSERKQIYKEIVSAEVVSNTQMGYIFEELIRKFSEQSNETAGEHYTPREVIQLMVEIMFTMDKKHLEKAHTIKTIYDPCCGTGGMLSVSKKFISDHINKEADIYLYGQELNPVTWAMCKADMLIKGELGSMGNENRIRGGEKDHSLASTLSNDQFHEKHFDYILCNPPYGVDWKKDKEAVEREASRGFAGRFGAGTPRSSDGQLLFLQHMVTKMQNLSEGGGRIAVVYNGSPLFTGDAGSGESEIRRWVLENDYLEAIVALPDQLFYNTGISTYLWFLTNRKSVERKGRVQLIDARKFHKKMRKNLGNKRYKISDEDRKAIMKIYQEYKENKHCKIFKTTDFAFRQITIERPLRLKFDITKEKLEELKQGLFLETEADPEQLEFLKQQIEESKGSALSLATKQNLEDYLSRVNDHKRIYSAFLSLENKTYTSREKFLKDLLEAFKTIELKPAKSMIKTIVNTLSERDEEADICLDAKGNPEPDTDLRDTENVPYEEDVQEYFKREVLPYAPDAWIDESKIDHKDGKIGRVGYEIPVTRYFYTYEPPRPLEEIESDIEHVENELLNMLQKLTN